MFTDNKEILKLIIEIICIPGFIHFVAKDMLEYLNEKHYTTALITIIVVALMSWPTAICIAIYVGYKMTKKRKEEEYRENYNHDPAPGSTADYERWKAEREKEQNRGDTE